MARTICSGVRSNSNRVSTGREHALHRVGTQSTKRSTALYRALTVQLVLLTSITFVSDSLSVRAGGVAGRA
jgi:hypothetical protein